MRRELTTFRTLALSAVLLFVFVSAGSAFAGAPMVHPKNAVTIMKDGKTVGEFTKQFPLPNGQTLLANGPCVVKMQDVVLGVEDQTRFSVVEENGGYAVRVDEGTLYFGISRLSSGLSFATAEETVRVEQVLLNASTNGGILRGVMHVGANESHIGVIDGGALRLATLSGSKLIKTDQMVAFTPKAGPVVPMLSKIGTTLGAGTGSAAVVGGAALTAGAVGGGILTKQIVDSITDGNNNKKDASPSTP